ncbi:unnamed protein product [Boreogadus saida]
MADAPGVEFTSFQGSWGLFWRAVPSAWLRLLFFSFLQHPTYKRDGEWSSTLRMEHVFRVWAAPKKAKRRQQQGEGGGSSNVFSMFEQSQIQEYKEAFTIIDQNRDGIISKDDLRDVLATMGQLNVKNEELEAMVKEASGPINFTVFLTMFGEKLKGADPEDVIVSAFKVLDPEVTGSIKKEMIEELLTTQCDRFTAEEMTNLWAAFPPDVAGNVDYKNICYVITHGEDKEEEE